MAPYVGLIESMSQKEKLAVVSYIVATIPNFQIIEKDKKHYKREADFTDEDKAFLDRKMKNLEISPRIEQLCNGLRLTESEEQDARTQYILGKQ